MQNITPAVRSRSEKLVIRDLYDSYGGMLLGYLVDVIGTPAEAENYLVQIFDELPDRIDAIVAPQKNTWLQLQNLAKEKLSSFVTTRQDCRQMEEIMHRKWTSAGSRMAQLTSEQRTVFCGIYYHNKNIQILAREMQQPESIVKEVLKKAFNIIRNGR